jgi:short-subunit dehydrogenase
MVVRQSKEKHAFCDSYGPWALVAGASAGIGQAFARRLAGLGLDLLLVDLPDTGLESLADELKQLHGVSTVALNQDLSAPDLIERLLPAIAGRQVGLLVYNAAQSYVGPFFEESLADKKRCIEVNCRGPLLLAHGLGKPMVERGRGGMIFMSSLAGTQGHRLLATYAASKAFNWILGEALWDELRGKGVHVLAVCAGMTRTPGFEASGPHLSGLQARLVQEPERVVEEALNSLGKRPSVVTGMGNRLTSHLNRRLLPRGWASAWLGRMMESIYPGRRT